MTKIAWNSPDAPPETLQGDCRAVLITVEVPGGNRYCVPAFYLNGMSLVSQAYECLAGLTDDECEAQHMDGCPVTGFYEASPFEGEPDGMYSKPYGEVIAWAAFPEPCAALSDNEREEKPMIRICRDCHWWRQSPDEPKLGECQWTPPPMLLFFMNTVAPTDDVDRICITQAVEECSEFLAAEISVSGTGELK